MQKETEEGRTDPEGNADVQEETVERRSEEVNADVQKEQSAECSLHLMGIEPVVLARLRPYQCSWPQVTKMRTSYLDMNGVVTTTRSL